jgi:hypothetical protein
MTEWVIKYQPNLGVWLFEDYLRTKNNALVFGKLALKPYLGGKVFTGEIDQYYLLKETT